MNNKKILEKIEELKSLINNEEKIELESENFRVNSDGWKKIIVEDKEYLVNDTEDIWELNDGEYKGEQLFTFESVMRETKKAGKRMPTDEEFDLFEKEDYGDVKYVGYRDYSGAFYNLGSGAGFWSSSVSGSRAWRRYLSSAESRVSRYSNSQTNGFSVRCIREFSKQEEPKNMETGQTIEELLRIGIERLIDLNNRFECKENNLAIIEMQRALRWLNRRTEDREKRCVEGKHQK